MTRLTDAQLAFRARARELAQTVIAPRAAEVDRSEQYPWDNVAVLRDAGFFGMTIPQAYGGQGLGYLETCLLIEEMAKVCGVTGRIAVEANMGAIGAIMAYGTEAQKKLAARLVLNGDKPAICITEPNAGSAATEMTTRAEKKGDRYVINGKKHWITGGGVSKLHLIFARVFEDGVEQGIGGFIAVPSLLIVETVLINILPLPILDGGHIVLAAYEGIVGLPMPPKILVPVLNGALFLLLGFVVLVTFSDVLKIFTRI